MVHYNKDETSRKHICVCVLLMKAPEKNEAVLAGWLAGYATQKAEVLGPAWVSPILGLATPVSPGSHWEDTTPPPPPPLYQSFTTTNTTFVC